MRIEPSPPSEKAMRSLLTGLAHAYARAREEKDAETAEIVARYWRSVLPK